MKKSLRTIGYEGVTIEALLRALKDAGVKTVIDVRAVPLSRKPGFSKNKLAGHLAAEGIAYLGLRGLGTPAEGRVAARKGRTAEMHRIFRAHLKTEKARIDLEEAIRTAKASRACLLCYENDVAVCHRLLIAGKIAKAAGMAVEHLNPVLF
jgi:uncharacterized protein (DUF488 family)